MSLKGAITGCAAVLLGVALAAPAHAVLDHYKCYSAKDLKQPKFTKVSKSTSDQFVTTVTEFKKPAMVCNPVQKNGSPIINATDHLVCYKIKDQMKIDGPNVTINDQ